MDYSPPDHVAEQIALLDALRPHERESYVRAHGREMSPEALVHLLRTGIGEADTTLFDLSGRLLVGGEGPDGRCHDGHCEGIIMALAKYYGFHVEAATLQDYRATCHSEMWKAVYAGSSEKPFWSIRFGWCMKRLCIQVARGFVRARQRQGKFEERLPEWDPEGDEAQTLGDGGSLEDEVLRQLDGGALMSAVRRLPARLAQAVTLAWIEQRPIEGKGQDTVAGIIGVTPRRVYQLLREARARLLEDPVVRARADDA